MIGRKRQFRAEIRRCVLPLAREHVATDVPDGPAQGTTARRAWAAEDVTGSRADTTDTATRS
jgi:hypothetical protein